MNRRDEVANQDLANDLAESGDKAGIDEVAANLSNRNSNVRSDCLKVLYEIGYKRPELIAPYAKVFLGLLADKNNRMIWGAMIALAAVAEVDPGPIWREKERIISAIDSGSLITLVWGIRALARAAAGSSSRKKRIMAKLQDYLRTCNARDVPTHLESMLPIIDKMNWAPLSKVLETRKGEMTTSHLARLKRVLNKASLH